MDKQIPIYFDSVVVSSPLEKISENNTNLGRLQVRVFTKYANRNGSYITDAVAEQLIASATKGNTPVIGFFDPSTKTWASHTGPTLANAYGYVEGFNGWQPFTDTDGVTREYAVFSVVLFTKYFEEARNILGQNQSMELNPASITGDWALIENEEYYVFKTAEMLGFCIIGEHEPCFSVSAFFSKNDNEYKSQYEKFSSLLNDLKLQVEKYEKGGETPMDNLENQEVVEEVVTEEVVTEEEKDTSTNFEQTETEPEVVVEEVVEETPIEEKSVAEPSEFELLQARFDELQNLYNELNTNYAALQEQMNELQASYNNAAEQITSLSAKNEELQNSISSYEAAAREVENEKKTALVEKYKKILTSEEEIGIIEGQINDFSYDELESKLAILFANQQLAGSDETINKVPLPEPAESQFALLMKKYRKN